MRERDVTALRKEGKMNTIPNHTSKSHPIYSDPGARPVIALISNVSQHLGSPVRVSDPLRGPGL